MTQPGRIQPKNKSRPHGVLDRACRSQPSAKRFSRIPSGPLVRGIHREIPFCSATARRCIALALGARRSGRRTGRLRSARRRLRQFLREVWRPGGLRSTLRSRSPLPGVELFIPDRPHSQCDLLAKKSGDAVASQSVLRVGGERCRRDRPAKSGGRVFHRSSRRRLPRPRSPGRYHGQDLRRDLPYGYALPGLDLFPSGILRRARRRLLPERSCHAAATRPLLHLRGGAVTRGPRALVVPRQATNAGMPGPAAGLLSPRSADRDAVDPQRRLADADRHALAVLAASADAGVEREIVADHGDAG